MNKIHELIHRLHNNDLGILFLRLMLGVVFIHAGWLKVTNMAMVVTGFDSMGFPAAVAYLVAYAEFLGGLLLVVGIFTRYVGIVFAIIMLVATFKVHFVNGFGLQNGGYEYTLALLLGSLAQITMGAGKYSLAGWLKQKKAANAPQA